MCRDIGSGVNEYPIETVRTTVGTYSLEIFPSSRVAWFGTDKRKQTRANMSFTFGL